MFSGDMLEDEFRDGFTAWKKAPGPESNAAMLSALGPTIEGAVRTHVGEPNPLITSRARLMALEGLNSYDPKRGRLKTHLYNQLQGLKRVNRQQTSVLRVPERVALDRGNLENAVRELSHTLGREPTDDELSDHTGFSRARVAKVRSYAPGVSEGAMEDLLGGLPGGVRRIGPSRDVYLDVVYDELDAYHKRIMEHTLGMNGRQKLSNQDLAAKMGRSPGAISQAKARIQAMLDDAQAMTEGGF